MGNVSNARASLLAAAQLLENGTVLEPNGRCELLAKTYFRLYVLETRVADENAADAFVIKAKYWSIKRGELQGVPIGQIMDELKRDSPKRIMEYIDQFD